ncbi:peptidoglycan-binding domain-containing protein [Streptomyces pinistramenti]|uniref:peptidoglycan-binding domain-containing protein n=1 Tax=Streptomyces pinistramenti TaxID=2884812 RepID=UPI001D088B24|nr:peptidoglycan-binding domain-containing protein [Streptomyces pinistramenti]MCB5907080.1 peptidoglycan-binding protein [Streptomyces pinistramenti]
MTSETCPHCCAPVRGDGRPTCLCAAVAEDDFDPLRVRPYVSLPDPEGPESGEGPGRPKGPESVEWAGRAQWSEPSDVSEGWEYPDPCVPDLSGPPASPQLHDLPDLRNLRGVRPVDRVGVPRAARTSPDPLAPRPNRAAGPTSRTVSSSEPGEAPGGGPAAAGGSEGTHRSGRKRALLAVAGAAVAASAVLAGSDARSSGADEQASAPDRGLTAPTAPAPTDDDRPSENGAPTSRSANRSPAPVRSARPPDTSASAAWAPGTPDTGQTALRQGSEGPEVAELQHRLRQLGLYLGTDDGRYDAAVRDAVTHYQWQYGVQGDPEGVYGSRTRGSLEYRTHAL